MRNRRWAGKSEIRARTIPVCFQNSNPDNASSPLNTATMTNRPGLVRANSSSHGISSKRGMMRGWRHHAAATATLSRDSSGSRLDGDGIVWLIKNCNENLPIDLPVGAQRQGLDRDHSARDHIVRNALSQFSAGRRGSQPPAANKSHDASGVSVDHGPCDRRDRIRSAHRAQMGFYLFQLHAVPQYLDLA